MSAAAPQVSVVTATHNRAAQLGKLLDGLRAQTLATDRFEVVIVDDCSGDETASVLAAAEAAGDLRLRSIRHQQNEGRAKARQDGWQAAQGELIAFTDDDCVPTPEWLEAGLAACVQNPRAIVQGRTSPDPAEVGRLGPFARTVDVPEYDAAFQTCNIFYPRELLERVGGFDVAAFGRVHGGEDSDLAWRAIKAGAAAVFEPGALVHHDVNELGALAAVRFSAGWSLLAYARHGQLRRAHFAGEVFWKQTHAWLFRALLGLLLPRRLWPLKLWLALPWVRSLRARGILVGGGLKLAPFYAACDVAEIAACIRNSAQHGRLIL